MGNGVKNDGQRRSKTTGNKIYPNGQRNLSEWATKFIRMGNEIYPNGQRNSSEWATKFIRMGKQAATCEYAL